MLEHVNPEAFAEDAELDDECGDEEVEGDGGPCVVAEEHHQESETNEDHNMHILKHRVLVREGGHDCPAELGDGT